VTVPAEFIALAGELADAAGAVARRYFRTRVEVIDKPDLSPVTIADREAEAAMRALIERRFPTHGIFGEEHGRARTEAEFVWVLDPIDGTKSFISGVPLFGTLVALTQGGRPILGIIDQPISGERWLGVAGEATTLNGAPVRTRACDALARATLFSTTPEMFRGDDGERFRKLAGRVKLVRYGADCYAYGLVAAGFIDAVVEAELKPYDFSAMVPIIEGAGGVVTDWNGVPLHIGSGGRVAAGGDTRVHDEALAILQGAAAGR
jgi:inositol-phosphate phosphatase/L-galactose 1-phosphate phosphatase/histidinol-phosphatase